MWWSDGARLRRALVLASMSLLAGCGLTPLYGGATGERVRAELATVAIDAPRSRLGAALREALLREIEAAGPPAATPRYLVKLTIERRRDALLVQLDDSITRYELTLTARYDLLDVNQDRVLLRTAAQRSASFNVVQQPYADAIAERDAEERAARELARAIRNRLALFFAGDGS
jgi:LPS-assembly lipoprotein